MEGETCWFDLDGLEPDALELLVSAEGQNLECGPAWYGNLIRSVYRDHRGIRFYVVRRGAHAVAVLPVKFEVSGLGRKMTALTNCYSALYQPAFAADLRAAELVVLLASWRRGGLRLSSLEFAPMDPLGSAFLILREALKLAGWATFDDFCFGNWYLPVDMRWKDYFATRDSQQRHTIERSSRKFARAGGRLEIVTGVADLIGATKAYNEVYGKSWKEPEAYPEFMPGLIRTAAEHGWLRLGVAWLGTQPIAAQVWIVAHGRAEIYKLAYDESFKAFAPGTLLTSMLMQQVLEVDKVREVDYLIGDDAYKKSWVSQRRERWGIVAYNANSPVGLMQLMNKFFRRKVKQWIAPWRPRV